MIISYFKSLLSYRQNVVRYIKFSGSIKVKFYVCGCTTSLPVPTSIIEKEMFFLVHTK